MKLRRPLYGASRPHRRRTGNHRQQCCLLHATTAVLRPASGVLQAGVAVLRPTAVVLLTGVDTSPANLPGFFLRALGTVVRLGASVAVGVVGICLLFLCGIEDDACTLVVPEGHVSCYGVGG